MRLNFKKIQIHSFMSFDDEIFEFDKHNGITLIRGLNKDIPEETNGAGKTSVFLSLIYVLFGQTPEDVNNKNIVNRYVKDKDMRLVLELDADGKNYKIIRGLNKGKLSYLELYQFNEDITKSTILETQQFIEKEIVKCDMPIFLRTVMLTASQDYNFYKLKKQDKKEFVERLFDISIFENIYQIIHHDILNIDKDIISHQNKLMILNKQDNDYKQRLDKYEIDKQNRLQQIKINKDQTEAKYAEIKQHYIKTNTDETNKLNTAINKIQNAKKTIVLALADIIEKNQKFDLSIHKLTISKDNNLNVIDKYRCLLDKLCDDCRPIVKDYYKLNEYEKDIKLAVQKIEELNNKINSNNTKKIEYQDKITKLDEKLIDIQNKLNNLTAEFNKTNKQLLLLENQLQNINIDLNRINSEQNPFVDLYDQNKKEIDSENMHLEQIEERYKYLKFAESIVSQETIRKFIIQSLIGLLNNKIKTYLTKMGSKYTVIFDSDMNYKFMTNGGECQFGNFSNGEKTRIMIATSFAFRDFMSIRNGLNTNILICDEFFDSAISSACLKRITEILREYVNDYNQNIYIITQRQELEPTMIDNVIQVVKQNDISKITYINN